MKTALVTTTINVPTVLALYRKLDSAVKFYVAADEKTPLEAYSFCADLGGCEIYSPDRQKELGYSCLPLLGTNTDSLRNIALLEALKDGAEIIISVDDDMLPVGHNLFNNVLQEFSLVFSALFSGLQFGEPNRWFDAGMFTIPPAKQRGLPVDQNFYPGVEPVVNAKIGVAQGIILGVPDADAMTAIVEKARILSVTDVLRNSFVVHPRAYSVFNSQLTAFRRELAPAFAQYYNHQGRNTDIMASLLMRRIMRELNLHTYFGPPAAFHARQPRPLFNDLKAELWGLEHVAEWAEYLNRASLDPTHSVVDQCRVLTAGCNLFSDDAQDVAMAWYDDCESVL
jgi:hypothetical protein